MLQNNNRKMKDSGIPWMPSIPDTWEVQRGKNILVLNKRPVRESDEVVTCFRDGEVILRSERRTDGFTMSDKEIGYQGINKGDIVIHGMDGFAGSMGVSKSTGKGSPVLVVCSPKYDAVPQFIIYYLRTLAMTDVFVALSTGIRERSCDLRWNKIAELQFALPSSTTQQRIADFLDRKCAEIDELAALQETMIAEMKRYKQSVITEAVTKGLDPNVPMKDSGVEWIGEIPEGWKINKGKHILTLLKRKVRADDEVVTCFRDGEVVLRKERRQEGFTFSDKEIGYQGINKGDIVIHGMDGFAGAMGVSKSTGKGSPVLIVCVPTHNDHPQYIIYYLRTLAMRNVFLALATGIRERSCDLRWNKISELAFLLPPLSEQRAIADYLDKKCAEIDELIAIKQQKIEALKEYKKSVIFEYVTGKKEVDG